jgi:hypothetical protein
MKKLKILYMMARDELPKRASLQGLTQILQTVLSNQNTGSSDTLYELSQGVLVQ